MNFENYVAKAMNYSQYINLLQDLLAQGKTTGENQSEAYLNYAKINLQRMQRLDKTVELSSGLKAACSGIKKTFIWLVITEGWCGDAAQNLPVLEKIAVAYPVIQLKLILRDEHPELMDGYLTNGTRSIPKLICIDKESMREVFTWGPRPDGLQELVMELKKNGTPYDEKAIIVQKWYNADKTLSVQKEFTGLIDHFLYT